jgi:chromosome segregation ATPase
MSPDIHESTESHASSPNIFASFYRDLLSVIGNVINQYHADYKDQIKALSDRVIHLEESQEKWITSNKKLMEEYQNDVLMRSDARIKEFTTTIQFIRTAVQDLENQADQPQQIKAELTGCVEELHGKVRMLSKITDQLVSDMNQLEVKHEELDKEFLTMSEKIQAKKRRLLPWF